jgi:hypothetical protein
MSAGTGTGIIPLRLRHLIMVEDTTTAMAITAAERLTAVRRATRSRTAFVSPIAVTDAERARQADASLLRFGKWSREAISDLHGSLSASRVGRFQRP